MNAGNVFPGLREISLKLNEGCSRCSDILALDHKDSLHNRDFFFFFFYLIVPTWLFTLMSKIKSQHFETLNTGV